MPPSLSPLELSLIPYMLSTAALVLSVYLGFRKESREDGQTTSQRLKKLEVTAANHEQRHTGLEQAGERLAEHIKTDIDTHSREVDRRFKPLETAVEELPRLRESMARMEEKLKGIDKIETKLDRLTELLTRPK